LEGLTEMLAKPPTVMITEVEPLIPPEVTTMALVYVPGVVPAIKAPEPALIVPTALWPLAILHVKVSPLMVTPELVRPVAVKVLLPPLAIDGLEGLIVILARTRAAVTVSCCVTGLNPSLELGSVAVIVGVPVAVSS
jgi:hypothetical protein